MQPLADGSEEVCFVLSVEGVGQDKEMPSASDACWSRKHLCSGASLEPDLLGSRPVEHDVDMSCALVPRSPLLIIP